MTGRKEEKRVFLGGESVTFSLSLTRWQNTYTRLLLEIMCTVFVIEGGYSQDQPSVRGIKRKKCHNNCLSVIFLSSLLKKKNFFCTSLFGWKMMVLGTEFSKKFGQVLVIYFLDLRSSFLLFISSLLMVFRGHFNVRCTFTWAQIE